MARPKRINFPHLLYHVFSRTNSGDIAFHDPRDMEKFLEYLAKYTDIFDFRIHAFCLMPTHFHILAESGASAELSEFMKRLLTAYTVFFNKRHNRHGHLFQGRFKSRVVDKADYLLTLSRYIHLNPAEISRKKKYETYTGSSMRFYIKGGEPSWLHTQEILNWFKRERRAYRNYVKEGLNEKRSLKIIKQRYIGGKPFADRMKKRIGRQGCEGSRAMAAQNKRRKAAADREEKMAVKILKAVAKQYGLSPEPLRQSRYARGEMKIARSVLINLLCRNLPWNYQRIADYVGLTQKSGIFYHLRREGENEEIAKGVKGLQGRIKSKKF